MSANQRKKLLIIDGNSILNRAFYGVRPMTTRDGRPTNAIYGFINMLLKPIEALSPDAAAIAFDLKAPTFRHKKCDFYKANRKGMPDELAAQLDGAKRAADCLGLTLLSLEGYEADDILGSASRCAENDTQTDYDCYIMTGDRDSLQLVGKKTFVMLCTNNDTILYDTELVSKTYGGLTPFQLIDLKALMGDTSDNIPGVGGIGEKTAIKLMTEFGSLDNLYASYEGSELSAGIKAKLERDKEQAYTSRFLAEIYRDVPLPLGFEALKYNGIKTAELYSLLSEFELKSIIKRMGLDELTTEQSNEPSLFDIESGEDNAVFEDFLRMDCVPALSGEVGILPDFEGSVLYIDFDKLYICPLTRENLKTIAENPSLSLVVYDSKELFRHLLDVELEPLCDIFDVMLADYVVSPSAKGGVDELLVGKSTRGFDISSDEQKKLLCTSLLKGEKQRLERLIEANNLHYIYYEIELPLSKTLARIENAGFLLDREGISQYGKQLDERLRLRISNIHELAGCDFNINSPKQLAEVLFTRLSLPGFKKTKNGFSTDAETLEKLRPYHPIINEILDYRTVAKLKSTYVEGLLKVCTDENPRVHTTFKQALTATGRLSSVEPNLQNIPIRQPEGRELRRFFVAKEGYTLVDADYSQIELRILAALSNDKTMCEAFTNGTDIHTLTASEVFGVSTDEVTPEMRKSAKAVNFGIVYGISDFSLAGDIGTTRKKAAEYIEKYFKTYPDIRKYLDNQIEQAQSKGYICTLFGRRRYIPELAAKNKVMQAFGKRVAMNSPIQGTAADIIKLAMIKAEKALLSKGLDAKIILQVHDELVVECREEDSQAVCELIRHEMSCCLEKPLAVPLEVSVECGKTWFDAHS